MTNELYNRQEKLNLNIPEKVGILGAGGIGSNLAVDLALLGVKEIIIVDYDIVEESNRNRTPFRTEDVGKPKVEAVEKIIASLRRDCIVFGLNKRVNELSDFELKQFDCIIVDCRDNIDKVPKEIQKNLYCKLGYDGLEVTIDYRCEYHKIFGDTNGYAITPSFIGTPRLLTTLFILNFVLNDSKPNKIINFKVGDLIKIIK